MSVEVLPGITVPNAQVVRVTRVVVFEGPAEWVVETLRRRWLRKGSQAPLADNRKAEEISIVLEVVA